MNQPLRAFPAFRSSRVLARNQQVRRSFFFHIHPSLRRTSYRHLIMGVSGPEVEVGLEMHEMKALHSPPSISRNVHSLGNWMRRLKEGVGGIGGWTRRGDGTDASTTVLETETRTIHRSRRLGRIITRTQLHMKDWVY
jgi:hypothetical protein